MSRSRSSKNDWRRYRKFEQDNEKLKKEISKLRKMVNTMVVDQLEERATRVKKGEEPIVLTCEICGNNNLRTISIKRTDGEWEIKTCVNCNHRTQMKKIKEQKEK